MKISVVIPVWNESENIVALVTFIQTAGGSQVAEIIVVDGQSTDNTAELSRKAGALTLISPIRSRAYQMNLGAKHASGEILYFIHADIKLIPSFVPDIISSIESGFHSGCYRYVFDSDKLMLKVNAFFTRFDRIMCRGGDQTLFVVKTVFDTLEGFDESFSIMEDYDFIIRLRRNYRFKIIPKNVVVSARKYETNSWLRVQLANLAVFVMFFLNQPPDRMKVVYKKLLSYR